MTSFRFTLALSLLLAATALRAEEPLASPKHPEVEYLRPELIAMTWHQFTNADAALPNPKLWRPDGSLLDESEVEFLRKELTSMTNRLRLPANTLRPLLLVFRIDERAKSRQLLVGSLRIREHFQPSGGSIATTKHFLAQVILAPNRAALGAWPEEIDVQVLGPAAEPVTVNSFKELPDGVFQVDPGVRWHISKLDGVRTVDGRRQSGFPAAVLEIDSSQTDPSTTYFATVRLKNGQLLLVDHSQPIDPAGKVTVQVSQVLDEKNPVVSAEFVRRRHRKDLYEKLPTRLDLKPEDPQPAPAIPDVKPN